MDFVSHLGRYGFLVLATLAVALASASEGAAQVHYFEDGGPWNRRASGGPDAEVDGWYYNLGITGLRIELVPEAPTHLVVRHVFARTPAAGHVEVGDHIVGAGGSLFTEPHRNGYGMDVFGAHGPVADLAVALEAAQTEARGFELELAVLRAGDVGEEDSSEDPERVVLKLPRTWGAFAPNYPQECGKSEKTLAFLLDWLVEHQRDDGSWGLEPRNLFAPLALMSSTDDAHRAAVERCARFHARSTHATDDSDGLVNWRYMAAAIVLSEYYLSTREEWVLPELREVRDFLMWSQYTDLEQRNPRVKESHPHDWPTDPLDSHGGWGHNPGFEGYGPIAMLTGQGVVALSLLERCGVEIERERFDAACAFLERASGANGYVWYGDEAASDTDWADLGRTGAAAIGLHMSPFESRRYRSRAREHAVFMGEHPESFPDTHGSPVMGMGFGALGAFTHPDSFRRLMDANRWWFALAQCADGSFYYQPNRDNAGYGADSRLSASAVTAFVLSLPKRRLALTGRADAR